LFEKGWKCVMENFCSSAPQPEVYNQLVDPCWHADDDVGVLFEDGKFFQNALDDKKVEVQPDHPKALPAKVNDPKASKKKHSTSKKNDALTSVPKGPRFQRRPTGGPAAAPVPQPSRDIPSSGTEAPANRPKRYAWICS
jgi:hypothetical protein